MSKYSSSIAKPQEKLQLIDANKDLVVGGFVLHRNGIEPQGTPTFEQWQECGNFIKKANGAVHFWIGDWLNYGEQTWGEMYSQAMDETDFEYQTLANDKWLAKEIHISLRGENMDVSSAKLLAPLPQKEKEYWANELKKEKIPVRELKERIKEKRKKELPQPKTPKGKYKTIVIDPPWPMEYMHLNMRPKQVIMPYPTMTLDEIKDFSVVKDIADDECNLFIWTTHKFLPDTFDILETWGFKYHICLTWDKTNGRSLFGFNRRTELVLYAYKGKITVNQRGKFIDSVFVEKLREHSRKPDIFYEMLKSNTPEPRIDIFGRGKHDGFSVWGNEEGKFDE